MKRQIILDTKFITSDQVLKEATAIDSGGQVKRHLAENTALVDGEPENRRRHKLYLGMMIEAPGVGTFFMVKKGNGDNKAK